MKEIGDNTTELGLRSGLLLIVAKKNTKSLKRTIKSKDGCDKTKYYE
jgi:hypothetical protein